MSPRTALHRPERLPRKDAVDATHVAVLPERSPAETANNDAMPAHMDESGYPLGLERFRILPGEAGGVKEGLRRWRNLKQPLDYSALCRALQQCAPYAGLVYFSQLLKHLVDKRRMASRTEARMISVKRVYEPSAPLDGVRLLVERLWPRGMRKEPLRMEAWLKDNSLRGREGSYRFLERRRRAHLRLLAKRSHRTISRHHYSRESPETSLGRVSRDGALRADPVRRRRHSCGSGVAKGCESIVDRIHDPTVSGRYRANCWNCRSFARRHQAIQGT